MISNQRVASLLCFFLAIVPVMAVDMPKALAVYPGLIGVIFYCLYRYGLKINLGLSKNALALCGIIFGLSCVSLIWAAHIEASSRKVIEFALLLPPQILLISLASRISREQVAPYIHYYSYAIVIGTLLVVLETFWGGVIFNLTHGRPSQNVPEIYEYNRGVVLLVMCSFGAMAILKEKFQHHLAPLLIIIPLLGTLIFSVCQSAQLMFIVGFATLFLFPYKSRIAWSLLKGLILIMMLVAPFAVSILFHHMTSDLANLSIVRDASGAHRLEIWDYVARYALHRPFFGYGVEVTRAITDFDCAYIFNPINTVIHPHNFVLQIWIEFGLVGILIAMGLIYHMLTLIQENYTVAQQKILLPTVAAGLVAASVSYGMWQGMWIGALFYAGAMTLIAVKMVAKSDKT